MIHERGITHLLHSAIIGVVLYLILLYVVKQSSSKAENMSVLVGGAALVYMVLFGHGPPTKLNTNLF
jgi:low temperature requirement protein LtrA|tara:strand:- start:66 stop:266 length:201 start_codon:yes stop_codon:yes gene_type:complete